MIMPMFDFLWRALRHPIDYLPVLRWQRVALLRHEEHGNGVHSFVFKKPSHLSWKAGQHGIWWWFGSRLSGGNWRAFSIASSCHEDELRIGTNIPAELSAFKKKLLAMQPGDTIWLQGPFGEFHTVGTQQIVGIAGGIGITPFRALAYDIAHGHIPGVSLHLIYSARDTHTYRQELEDWTQITDALGIEYVHTPEEVNTALETAVQNFGTKTPVFLSGSPGMITALIKSCQEKGVQKIVSDPFKGY